MPKVKITASPKVGTIAFDHEGDLVLIADGAVVDASAWAAAQRLDALQLHLAKGRISAAPLADDGPEGEL